MNQNYLRNLDDKELVNRLLQDDEGSFTLLYEKYWPVLVREASGFVADSDTCKEIVQELFVTLYRKRSQLKIKISLASFLYVSLRNKIRNHIRHQSIYNRHLRSAKRSNPTPTSNDVEQFVNRVELEKEIDSCLNGMSRKCREVYLLYQQNRFPLKHIAAMLNRPVDTVEKQFRKAVRLLRAHLSDRRISA